MHILCLGLNYTSAPISLREKLAFSETSARAALARLGCGKSTLAAELVLLSTCNRIELYAASHDLDFQDLEAFLAETRGVPISAFQEHLYRHTDMEAVRHLFSVSAGLDSMVLGEPQILGQVSQAFEIARGVGSAGPILTRLFHAAIHTGKRTHSETAISRNPASISSLAASLIEHTGLDLNKAQVVVLGAGEMAELAVEALRNRGAEQILVVNRSLDRAEELAKRWNAEVTTFEMLENALERADIVISSTSAPHIVVPKWLLAIVMTRRAHRAMSIIDIAVPRDIDPAVNEIPQVRLYDIDQLQANLEESLAKRQAEVPLVKTIIEEEVDRFISYMDSLDMLPLISDLRQRAELIRQEEVRRTLRRMPNLGEDERKRIEAMSLALVKKLMEAPTSQLRAAATQPQAPEYATIARSLFGLNGKPDGHHERVGHTPNPITGD